jgi:hypothetical protein
MSETSPLSERRAKLSPEQLSLLQRRLKPGGNAAPAREAIVRSHVNGPVPVSFAQQGQWRPGLFGTARCCGAAGCNAGDRQAP